MFNRAQPVTQMTISRTSSSEGLIFLSTVMTGAKSSYVTWETGFICLIFDTYFHMDFPFDADDARRTEWREQVLAVLAQLRVHLLASFQLCGVSE